MDGFNEDLPQLSNEMLLCIMNKVKNGELSVEEALHEAKVERLKLLQTSSQAEEVQKPSQYNFSVHKHGRYRWQKRVLQIDFRTHMVCSIEKGIIKRQLPFSRVKSCEGGVGSRFTISFRDHHDYDLEASSLEDKHKMMQLVNQIIYANIYSHPTEGDGASRAQSLASRSLLEGTLLLHRGGLASFKWVKYEARLYPGQLILVPLGRRAPPEGEVTPPVSIPTIIHLSDGLSSLEKAHGADSFTLLTHKNEYHFRVSATGQAKSSSSPEQERNAWVNAIEKLCKDWKRKSQLESVYDQATPPTGQGVPTDLSSSSGYGLPAGDTDPYFPLNANASSDPISVGGGRTPSPARAKPAAKPSGAVTPAALGSKDADPHPGSPGLRATPPTITVPSSPPSASPPSSPSSPMSPSASPVASVVNTTHPSIILPCPVPHSAPASQRYIPVPPPFPVKFNIKIKRPKARTKAFHWDVVGSDKIEKSFWALGSAQKIELDTSRLYEQFAVQDLGKFDVNDSTNTPHIMLNPKIAHNFNIFLKSFPVQPGELKDKLFFLNEADGGLSDEQITSLRRYVPTPDDVEMYKSHKGPVAELHIVDQYMMEMCDIPFLSTRLDLLLTLRELPVSINDLQPLINQTIRMCKQLRGSGSFLSLLECLLAVGNYLNSNAGKTTAKGIRLSSLTKLSQLRGRDRNFTLLHALVEQIVLHEPGMLLFIQELAEFETIPGASIKGLTAEVDVLKNELQKVLQYRKTNRKLNAGALHQNFYKNLKTAIENYKTDISALTKTCEEMKKLYCDILVKFGEPMDQDSIELFGSICQFIHDFKKAHAGFL